LKLCSYLAAFAYNQKKREIGGFDGKGENTGMMSSTVDNNYNVTLKVRVNEYVIKQKLKEAFKVG
jgi:hypothetical protein